MDKDRLSVDEIVKILGVEFERGAVVCGCAKIMPHSPPWDWSILEDELWCSVNSSAE